MHIHYPNTQGFDFNKIYVIESLNDSVGDYNGHSGLVLKENCLDNIASIYKEINIEYIDIRSKEDWDNFFDTLYNQCKENGCKPFLHFEIHGVPYEEKKIIELSLSDSCLLIKNGDTVSFGEFSEAIKKINEACECNLGFTLGVCYGLLPALKSISAIDAIPFFVAVGSRGSLMESHLTYNFQEFFESLFASQSIIEAVKSLKASEVNDTNEYEIYDPHSFFMAAWVKYMNDTDSGKNLIKRMNECRMITGDRNQNIKNKLIFKKLERKGREEIYQKFKRGFYRLNQYPGNEEKFLIPKTIADFDKEIGSN